MSHSGNLLNFILPEESVQAIMINPLPRTLFLAIVFSAVVPVQAEQTGQPRRVLGADDSTRRLAIVAPDGSLEWEIPVGAIHDAWVLPGGNVLLQQGWTKILEVTPERKTVWEYDAGQRNGNAGRRVEVHDFQRLANGLTLIAESGTARIIEVDRDGKVQHEIKLSGNSMPVQAVLGEK